jgi:hypothetical protein
VSFLVLLAFAFSLSIYLTIAVRDIRYHYSLDGTAFAVPTGESGLHFAAGTLVTAILSLLLFGQNLPISLSLKNTLLSILPIILMAVGLVDEFVYHRPRCKNDPGENWNHAVLHFSMGSTLVLAYVHWY